MAQVSAVHDVDVMQAECCFHCGEPVPRDSDFTVRINNVERAMCCPGCRAAAALINDSGLGGFYEQRTAYGQRPDPGADSQEFVVYDDPALLKQFSKDNGDETLTISLLVGGVSCAACVWLIERSVLQFAPVSAAALNLQLNRLDITFSDRQLPPSALFSQVASLGYRVEPWHIARHQSQARADMRSELRRLAVAGFGMMQVGMFAIGLHAGDLQGMQEEYRDLLRWVSLAVSTVVVLFSARGFFNNAWRHLRAGALVMDLPVALAIGLAWLASATATLRGDGQVYFDSIVMFTFLLLLTRYLERRVRLADSLLIDRADSLLPHTVQREQGSQWQPAARKTLRAGDRLLVLSGMVVPLDGVVVSGESALREDAFSGESQPRHVSPGSEVFAGTVNLEGTLVIQASGDYAQSRLAALQRCIDQAQLHKPQLARLADRIAGHFVAAVLLITASTAALWWFVAPERALWVALSVLVVSCPCALSLATPAALASSVSALRRSGILVLGEQALETLPLCTRVVFDKTGTLTEKSMRVQHIVCLHEAWSEASVQALAVAMQRFSNHSLASAFATAPVDLPVPEVMDARLRAGAGIEATLGGVPVRMGSRAFLCELCPSFPDPPTAPLYWVGLCRGQEALAWLGLRETVRPEAQDTLQKLRRRGLSLSLLSGDNPAPVNEVAELLPFIDARAQQTPAEKRRRVSELQEQGEIVAMIGDGLNDAPVLRQADVSIAVAGATDLARAQADVIIVEGDLRQVDRVFAMAARTRRCVRQNFAWALGYNVLAIPLAALGWVPPWAAALGMSLSSLLVVGNALRLRQDSGPR